MYKLTPGHILQFMYLRRRLRARPCRTFVEAGSGNGLVSTVLLDLGLTGVGFDRSERACGNNRAANAAGIASGCYDVRCADFIEEPADTPVDLVISSMVIEHLTAPQVDAFFARCRDWLRPGGMIVTLVPASPRHWGIEDETAGHRKRYTRECFHEIARSHALRVVHLAGLTYPLSNLLLRVSNYAIRRAESWKLALDPEMQTLESGDRHIPGKTQFPAFTRFVVNTVTMWPFHLLQLATRGRPEALVLYCEMEAADDRV